MKFVILHGLASGPGDWDHVRRAIPQAEFHIPRIAFLESDYNSLHDLAQALFSSLPPEFKTPGTILAGNSLGGPLALALASRFKRVMLVASHISFSDRFLGRGKESFQRELGHVFHDLSVVTPEMKDQYKTMWKSLIRCRKRIAKLRRIKTMIRDFDYPGLHQAHQHKITLVCGRQDRISPLTEFESLLRTCPGMRLKIIDECGHAPPLERPAELAEILTQEAALAGR